MIYSRLGTLSASIINLKISHITSRTYFVYTKLLNNLIYLLNLRVFNWSHKFPMETGGILYFKPWEAPHLLAFLRAYSSPKRSQQNRNWAVICSTWAQLPRTAPSLSQLCLSVCLCVPSHRSSWGSVCPEGFPGTAEKGTCSIPTVQPHLHCFQIIKNGTLPCSY